MSRDTSQIGEAEAVVDLMLAGDLLARCNCGWRLVLDGRAVEETVVERLKTGSGLGGRLLPMNDQLPGMSAQLAQTWRWARARVRRRVAA